MFRCAVDIAESHRASIHLIRAIVVPPEFPPAAHVWSADRLPALMVNQATAQLRAFAARAPHLHVEVIVRESTQPWRLIIDVADEIGVDLILVGSHGYHGLDRLLGTNADKVANPSAHRRARRAPPARSEAP